MSADTPHQRAILRQSRAARGTRAAFPEGTRVVSVPAGAPGVVLRHVPCLDAQGGYLLVRWDTGHEGRISPIAVRVAPTG
jgi:hypothetical protein